MKKKIKLIIDSDVSNEVDDVFALAYALSRQDVFDIKLISVSPFTASYKRNSIHDNNIDSKFEAKRLMRTMGLKNTDIVKNGSIDFLSNDYTEITDASNEIIKLASKEKITILCIGTLTNVAIALITKPEISKNLKIIFLGTQNLLHENFTDANYLKDKKAFEVVLKNVDDLTIFPSTVAKQFVTSIYEAKNHLRQNKLGRYLFSKLNNSIFKIQNRGIHTIYDIGPVAYLINKNWFCSTKINANELLKEQEKLDQFKEVNYIFDLQKEANYDIWKDFINSITSVETKSQKNIFFTSDTHFSSDRVIKFHLVPFENVEQMNYELVKRWNSVVSKDDVVYHLGDFGEYNYIKRLNGKVTLILGNYEIEDMKKNKLTFEQFKDYLKSLGFYDVVKKSSTIKVDDYQVFLTHKPIDCKKDMINLYGHVHTLKPVNKSGFNVATTYFDFYPVSLKQMKNKITFIKKFADKNVFAE